MCLKCEYYEIFKLNNGKMLVIWYDVKNYICNVKINLVLLVKVMWYMSFLCVIFKYVELIFNNGGIKIM